MTRQQFIALYRQRGGTRLDLADPGARAASKTGDRASRRSRRGQRYAVCDFASATSVIE
jgi:hypothetical protein